MEFELRQCSVQLVGELSYFPMRLIIHSQKSWVVRKLWRYRLQCFSGGDQDLHYAAHLTYLPLRAT